MPSPLLIASSVHPNLDLVRAIARRGSTYAGSYRTAMSIFLDSDFRGFVIVSSRTPSFMLADMLFGSTLAAHVQRANVGADPSLVLDPVASLPWRSVHVGIDGDGAIGVGDVNVLSSYAGKVGGHGYRVIILVDVDERRHCARLLRGSGLARPAEHALEDVAALVRIDDESAEGRNDAIGHVVYLSGITVDVGWNGPKRQSRRGGLDVTEILVSPAAG